MCKIIVICFLIIVQQYADLNNREHVLMKSVLIINLEVKDNHEEAATGARLTLDLCQEVYILLCFTTIFVCYETCGSVRVLLFYVQIEAVESWEDSIDDIVAAFEKQHRRKLLYSVSFY